MGYLSDNIPSGSYGVICSDLYPFRIQIEPGFTSDRELRMVVRDVLPDVEEWQFSGRRRCPLPGGKKTRVLHPYYYAQNSRKMRQYTELVVFAFHTELQRSSVSARLTNLGFTHTLVDEPSNTPPGGEEMVIILP